jgi:hypothetical protein
MEPGGVDHAVECRRCQRESIAYHGRECSGEVTAGQERLCRGFRRFIRSKVER